MIRHVSDTAFLVAQHRALESARPDALFADPLAERLAGTRGKQLAESLSGSRMSAWTVAIRTRIIDKLIEQALARGVDMVVNLGAGLDTRPYRLELPSTLTWVEVDYPDLVALKEKSLEGETPRCRLERVSLDLQQVRARRMLLAQLDARASRILVLTEGLVPYLGLAEAGSLADDLRALLNVDSWILDYISPESIAYRKRTRVDREMGEARFKFEPADWFAFFAERGWRSREIQYLPVEGARLGRPAPLPWHVRALMKVLRPITPAHRREGFARFAGYVVLEPAPYTSSLG